MNASAREVLSSRQGVAARTWKILMLVSGVALPGMNAKGQAVDIGLDSQTRTEVVQAVAATLEARYALPDQGRAMADAIRKRNAEHAYDAFTDRIAFSKTLTEDLYAVGHDKHIHVDPTDMQRADSKGPGPQFMPAGAPRPPGPRCASWTILFRRPKSRNSNA